MKFSEKILSCLLEGVQRDSGEYGGNLFWIDRKKGIVSLTVLNNHPTFYKKSIFLLSGAFNLTSSLINGQSIGLEKNLKFPIFGIRFEPKKPVNPKSKIWGIF